MSSITIEEIRQALPNGMTVSHLLGQGGQGAVFAGVYQGHRAAIKVISPLATEQKRVDREVQFLVSNQHENVVRILEYAQCSLRGQQFPLIAYEFLDGENLEKRIQSGHQPSEAELVRLGKEMGAAIEMIWSAKARVVHRDIKPANIMQCSDGRFVLVDFGFAKHIDLSNLTAIGMTAGTRGFMSPEQAMGRQSLTNKSDVFSLGITIFNYATKQHPYGGQQPGPTTPPTCSLNQLRPDLSDPLKTLIGSMLRVSPSDRPAKLNERFAILERP